MYPLIAILTIMTTVSIANASPKPNDVFREHVWKGPYVNAGNWQRVTDPDASHAGAAEFLPNPVNSVTLENLEGAVRAELYIEQWGGHAGTSAKRLRLNDNAWIDIDFGEQRQITRVEFRSRVMPDSTSIISSLQLRFDDGAALGPFSTPNPDVVYGFDLQQPVTARRVRVEAVATTGGNTGAREIRFLGPTP